MDNQVAIIEYANGVRATFHTNANSAILERRFYLLGSHGAIRAESNSGRIEWRKIGIDQSRHSEEVVSGGDHGGADEKLIDAFLRTVLNDEKPTAGMDEAIRSAVTCFGIDKAMDTGKVVDLRPMWKRAGVTI